MASSGRSAHLIVEVEQLDILREPRRIEADRHHRGKTVETMLDQYQLGMAVIITIGKPRLDNRSHLCAKS